MKKRIVIILALVLSVIALVSCGSEATRAYVDQSGFIVVEYDNGETKTLGKTTVSSNTATNATVDENGNIIVTFSDGSTQTLGKAASTSQITSITISSDNSALVLYSDGSSSVCNNVINESAKTLKEIKISESKHAIAVYNDGTEEDLGYVGVTPSEYTVTFVDADGNILKTEKVFHGNSATAPEAPEIADKSFDKWDKDFSSVESDLTVKPIYKAKATYTVVFKDKDNKTLKTETVVEGKSATAPRSTVYDDIIFSKWDTDFTNVHSDLVVKAIYRDRKNYTITFKDYNGLILGTANVKENKNAVAPVTPTREGYTFTGWSSSIQYVDSSKTVTAQYSLNSGNNIIDISYSIVGNTVNVTYSVKGSVKFAGCDIAIATPEGLTYKSIKGGGVSVNNESDGTVYINVASSSNITKETELCTVTYQFSDISTAEFNVTVSEFFDQSMNAAEYKIIGKTIKLK